MNETDYLLWWSIIGIWAILPAVLSLFFVFPFFKHLGRYRVLMTYLLFVFFSSLAFYLWMHFRVDCPMLLKASACEPGSCGPYSLCKMYALRWSIWLFFFYISTCVFFIALYMICNFIKLLFNKKK